MKISKGIVESALLTGVNVRLVKARTDQFCIGDYYGEPYPYVILSDNDSDGDLCDEFYSLNGAVLSYIDEEETENGQWTGGWVRLLLLPDGFAVPDYVESLGNGCIYTDRPYICLPKSIKDIRNYAFKYCRNLKYIIISGNDVDKARFDKMLRKNADREYLKVITSRDVLHNNSLAALMASVSDSEIPVEFKIDHGGFMNICSHPEIKGPQDKALNISKSFIAIYCTKPEEICLRKSRRRITLSRGVNILTVEDYPELKYGFCAAGFYYDDDGNEAYDYTESYPGIREIDLSHFDCAELTDTSYMFAGMEELSHLNLTGFNTSNVKDMSAMFYGCRTLKTLDLSGIDTSSVESTYMMFNSCSGLVALDLSGFDMRKVEDFDGMLEDISGVIDLSNWSVNDKVSGALLDSNQNVECVIMKNCNEITSKIIKDTFTEVSETDVYFIDK